MPAVPLRTSLVPHRELSTILFSRPDQHPSMAVSDLVSFGGSDDGELDDSLSLAASDAEELSGSYNDSATSHSAQPVHPAQEWTSIFSVSCLRLWRSWVWNGLPKRNLPVAAWINGFCRGNIRPLDNELRHSSPRSTTRSPNIGVHHTRPANVPLLPPPSLRSTMRKKKVTTACLPWMSQWPRISAHPRPLAGRQKPPTRQSRAGQLQFSLDVPIHRLDKRPQRFTPWQSCKCSRPNSSAQWMSLTRTRSFQQAAQCDQPGPACHQDDSPGDWQIHG